MMRPTGAAMRRGWRIGALGVLVLGLMAGSFLAGYLLARQERLDLWPVASVLAVEPSPAGSPSPAGRAHFQIVWEVLDLLEREFYDPTALDYQQMAYGAVRGMLETLQDPYTIFAPPRQARLLEEDIRGVFEGIGVSVEKRGAQLVVVAPLEGSPAQRAGLRPGDVILRVDGEETATWSLTDAVTRLRGPAGTTVQLTIQRGGQPPFAVTVVRARLRIAAVRTQLLPGPVAYVRLSSFHRQVPNDLRAALRTLLAQRPRGLVLDLRDNPGGLLASAMEVTGFFLRDGVVLYEQRRQGEPLPLTVRRAVVPVDLPMVVLVNRGTASAAEIVAGALQDHRRALLVGERTFGKGSVQSVHRLSDQSSLRVTFARWLTPGRRDIGRSGLLPDVVVPLTASDLAGGRDPQLEWALTYLRGEGQAE